MTTSTTPRRATSRRPAVEKLPGEVGAAHGQVDGLVNVAGIVHRFARVHELTFDEIERVMAVNFWGVVTMDKAFLPVLLARPQASLVNVSSMGALVPVPGQSAYGASKAAVKLLTEGLYAELRGTSVAVTVVFPGGVGTNILTNSGVSMPGRDADSSGTRSKLTSPADAGRQIIEAIEKGSYRVRIGGDARLLDRLSRLMPQRGTALVADRMKSLLER
jgi:short-subunit dehydrogenase